MIEFSNQLESFGITSFTSTSNIVPGWDINNINVSKELPQQPPVNPYEYPWVSSHLKTFRSYLMYYLFLYSHTRTYIK